MEKTMEKINGNEIVKFIYDTGYEQFIAESIDEATAPESKSIRIKRKEKFHGT